MVITAVAIGTRGDANPLAELGWEMIRGRHEKLETGKIVCIQRLPKGSDRQIRGGESGEYLEVC